LLGAQSPVYPLQCRYPDLKSLESTTPDGHASGIKPTLQGTSMKTNKVLSNSRNILYLSVITGIMSLTGTGMSFAQDEEANSEGVLEEVIVTATKRQESIQDVPLSIQLSRVRYNNDILPESTSGIRLPPTAASTLPVVYVPREPET